MRHPDGFLFVPVCPPVQPLEKKIASMECLFDSSPTAECLDRQCEQCGGEYQVLPKCADLRRSQILVPTIHYAYQPVGTKSGGTFQQLTEIKERCPMAAFWQSLNSDLPSFLWHHFGDKWLTTQEQYIDQNLVAGDLLV